MIALALATVVTGALLVMLAIALDNFWAFPRLTQPATSSASGAPRVSVLIPARDEAAIIGRTVGALLGQQPPVHEVLVLDDGSIDGTGGAAQAAAGDDSRLRVLKGAPLPAGWAGKNWACHQLGQAATGDVLLFTDADVCWEPGALAAVIGLQTALDADLFTVWPTQATITWSERLVVPLMGLAVMAYLPVQLVHRTPYAAAAAANGQCLAFRRAAYAAVGGHAAVAHDVIEDVTLAKRIKRAGLHLRMADGAGLVRCRMYDGWPAVRDGYAKNILAGHGNSIPLLLLSVFFHLAVFVWPWLWLLLRRPAWGWPFWPLLLVTLGVGVRATTARATRQRVRDAVWMPVSALLMTRIALHAIGWQLRYGGPRWKGRTLPSGATTRRAAASPDIDVAAFDSAARTPADINASHIDTTHVDADEPAPLHHAT